MAPAEQRPGYIKVLGSESGGFPIWADYTSVAAKVMTIEERRRMLTGDNLRKRTRLGNMSTRSCCGGANARYIKQGAN